MCGILAVVDLSGRPLDGMAIARLRDTMQHRGPDDAGLYIDGAVGLGHRRLSIIDLSRAGHQPMPNEDRSLHVVFNGEIYNYLELRRTLLDRGHRFRSTTDTEVILHQYEEEESACVERFRGMFSFVLWDRTRRRLFAARDRFGIKPLYYCQHGDRVLLASEIKAIVEDAEIPRRPDHVAIADYLYAGRALGNRTMFEGIYELEPGCHLTIDIQTRSVRVGRYWDLHYAYDTSRPLDRTIEELSAIVEESVAIHCRSDAPLGCHLSGGLDSSSVAAFARRERGRLKTFSIKFSDEPHIDETPNARLVAEHIGAEYLECSPGPEDMARLLPYLIWHMDVPMATDGGFAYYTVSEFARRHVKVALTGHGGDELFAGYPAQFQTAFGRMDMFRRFQDPDRVRPETGLIARLLQKGPRGVYESLRARASNRSRTLEDVWEDFHCDGVPIHNPLVHRAFVKQLSGYSPRDAYLAPLRTAPTNEALDRCLYHDMKMYLPSLLHLEDRVSMSVSLESRVPLLDHRIVEFLATVPVAQKVAGLEPKFLLRRLVEPRLPAKIWTDNVKRGFPVPGRFWKTRALSQTVERILLSKASMERGVFRPAALQQICRAPGQLRDVWPLLNVELWFKIFIDRDPEWIQRAQAVHLSASEV